MRRAHLVRCDMSQKATTDNYVRRSRKTDPSTPSQKKLREINRRIDVDRRKAIIARTAAGRAAITAFIGKTKRATKLPVIVVVAKLPPPVEVVQPPPPIAPPVAFDIFEFEKNPPKRNLPPLAQKPSSVSRALPPLAQKPSSVSRALPPLAQKPSSVSRAPVRERVPVKVPMALKMMDAQLRQQAVDEFLKQHPAPPPIPVDVPPSKAVARVKNSKPTRTAIAAPVDRVTGDVRKDLAPCSYCKGAGHAYTNCPAKVALRKALAMARFRARAAKAPLSPTSTSA
jgi:hypothetical protein